VGCAFDESGQGLSESLALGRLVSKCIESFESGVATDRVSTIATNEAVRAKVRLLSAWLSFTCRPMQKDRVVTIAAVYFCNPGLITMVRREYMQVS
jgi:hypothetical protein